jgi:hypothetical protein
MRRRLRQTRGYALATITGTVPLKDFKVGQTGIVRVYHGEEMVDGETDVKARFATVPVVSVVRAPGVYVQPLLDGTTGDTFYLLVTYVGSEMIIYGPPEGDMYVYPDDDECFYDVDDDGDVVLTWSRTGPLSDAAFS